MTQEAARLDPLSGWLADNEPPGNRSSHVQEQVGQRKSRLRIEAADPRREVDADSHRRLDCRQASWLRDNVGVDEDDDVAGRGPDPEILELVVMCAIGRNSADPEEARLACELPVPQCLLHRGADEDHLYRVAGDRLTKESLYSACCRAEIEALIVAFHDDREAGATVLPDAG